MRSAIYIIIAAASVATCIPGYGPRNNPSRGPPALPPSKGKAEDIAKGFSPGVPKTAMGFPGTQSSQNLVKASIGGTGNGHMMKMGTNRAYERLQLHPAYHQRLEQVDPNIACAGSRSGQHDPTNPLQCQTGKVEGKHVAMQLKVPSGSMGRERINGGAWTDVPPRAQPYERRISSTTDRPATLEGSVRPSGGLTFIGTAHQPWTGNFRNIPQ